MLESITSRVTIVENMFSSAASIDRRLPDRDRQCLHVACGWPDYLYDQDDRKDQEAEKIKLRITGKEIDLYDKVVAWLNILGLERDRIIILRKRIVWAKAKGYSYRKINATTGYSHMTIQRWYERDIAIIADMVPDYDIEKYTEGQQI